MSNRLNVAHLAPRREVHEFFQGASPAGGLAAKAVRWLSGLADRRADEMSPAMRRDLGLPELTAPVASFAYQVELGRVRV